LAIFDGDILAHNFELPITIRWDTTGYHDQVLYDYFGTGINYGSMYNNADFALGDNLILLEADSVVFDILTWPNLSHFPLFISLAAINDGGPGVNTQNIQKSSLKVYPNPANDFINIQFPNDHQHADEVSVHDLTGRLVLQEKGALSERVDVSSLPPGLYVVQARTSGGVYVGKVVVE
jgi:hypothetical protein